MIRKINKYVMFNPIKGYVANPYKGFVSFNHFRGDPLFSDCATSDGWKKERYPLSEGLEENGEETGWHPDTEVAYIRTIWKDFEPIEGGYNFALIDDILNKCEKHKQHLIFRLMPHTTRANEDVPDWLKNQIPCPERPTEERVKKSPEDPQFLIKFARAIKAIADRYDNNPIFYAIDISLFGAWGEGDGYEKADKYAIDNLIRTYYENFQNTLIVGQICAPELIVKANENGANIGWRADGAGNPYHMNIYFPNKTEHLGEIWKTAPVFFEAFWYMTEWKKQGWDMDFIAEELLKWHVSTFNNKSSTIPIEWKDPVMRFIDKCGYKFAIRYCAYPTEVSQGDQAEISFYVENLGVAPIYIKQPLTLRLKGEKFVKVFETDIDIRKWLQGDNIERLILNIPQDIPNGDYVLSVGLIGDYPRPTINFAFQTQEDGGYYKLCDIKLV